MNYITKPKLFKTIIITSLICMQLHIQAQLPTVNTGAWPPATAFRKNGLNLYAFDQTQNKYNAVLPGNSLGYGMRFTDTILPKKNFFQSEGFRMAIAPAIFFAASGLTWNSREKIREIRNRYIPTFATSYDNYTQYVPAVATFGLKFAGVKGRNKLGRTFISYAASAAIMATLVNTIKYTAKVPRPDGSSDNSFPSGHTSNAFMNATFMHEEYGLVNPIYSVTAYAMGAATGLGRGLNNRHWISDVLAGAGIGILSTELGYFFVNKFYRNKGDNLNFPNLTNPLDKPSYLALKVGYAGATHNLVKQQGFNNKSNAGFEAGIEGAYFWSQNWGVGADVTFSSFPITTDNEEIEDSVGSVLKYSIVTQSIGALSITAGPQFSHVFNNKWVLQVKLNAGVSIGAKGSVSISLDDDSTDENFVDDEIKFLEYKPKTDFAALGGLSFTRMLNPELGITLYAHYHYYKPIFIYTSYNDIDDPNDTETVTERNAMDYFSAGLKLTAYF